MSDKVVAMPGMELTISQSGRTVNPSTVAALEALLEQAQTGEVQAIALVSLDAHGSFKTGWTTKTNGDALFAIGALNVCAQEMIAHFVKDRSS